MPPKTLGCSVLTRPSNSGGKPVSSSTSRAAMPWPLKNERVPPVAKIATPRSVRARATSAAPLFSESEKSAASGNRGLRLPFARGELRRHDRTDAGFRHRHAVQAVREFHRLLVVRYEDDLRIGRQFAHHAREAF